MSVKIADLLRLPCMREATVVGGRGGLDKTVSSISVLEYSLANDIQEDIYSNIDFFGNEIIITAFAAVKDSVEDQCVNIRRLADVGEVGLILYYVGIILPRIDQALIDLADRLDFVLICMPQQRYDLRYSEVICEVMEAIFQDQLTDTWFQNEILERALRLPVYQRSIDNVLRMLSDRVRSTAVLTDTACRILNCASWPRTYGVDEEALAALGGTPDSATPCPVELGGESFWMHKLAVNTSQGVQLQLFLFRQDAALKPEAVRQVGEVVQLAINLWSQGHGKDILPELVRAILQNEPIKMRRIAEVYRVDVSALHNMWLIDPLRPFAGPARRDRGEDLILQTVRGELASICDTAIADVYGGSAVVFLGDLSTNREVRSIAEDIQRRLEEAGTPVTVTLCFHLQTTAQARDAFLLYKNALGTARTVYPGRRVFVLADLVYMSQCQKILEAGEEAVQATCAVLDALRGEERLSRHDLCETLSVCLLDAGGSVSETARRMYLHKNTIKYRLARMSERLGFPVGEMPATMPLHTALALERILAAASAPEKEG